MRCSRRFRIGIDWYCYSMAPNLLVSKYFIDTFDNNWKVVLWWLVQRQKTEGKEEIDDLKYVRLFGFAVVLVTVLKLLWIFPEKFNLFGIIEQNDAAYYSLLAFFTLIMAVICNYHWQNSKSLFKSKLRQSREFMFNIFVIGVAVYFAQATLTLFKGEPYSLSWARVYYYRFPRYYYQSLVCFSKPVVSEIFYE